MWKSQISPLSFRSQQPFSLVLCTLLLLQFSFFFSGTIVQPVTAARHVLKTVVHHAISYDRRLSNTENSLVSFGSRDSLLRGSIALFNPANIASHRKQTVFIPTEQHMTTGQWEMLQDLPVRGIVVALSPIDTHNENFFEYYLARGIIRFPVYFLPQDGVAARRLTETLSTLNASEYAAIFIGESEKAVAPVTNNAVTSINLYASLNFRPKGVKKSSEVPRVLITASFDTLGVAPSASTTGGASGVAAALELWRRFNAGDSLMEDSKGDESSQSPSLPFGFSVLLGNTARFNYIGTSKWIASREEGELDQYQLVICLDELLLSDTDGDNPENEDGNNNAATHLFMHADESFAKSPQFTVVKETAEATAARHGIALTVVSTKTNYHHYDVHFEHEVLGHVQIPAVTFSSVRSYRVDQAFRGSRAPISLSSINHTAGTIGSIMPNILVALNRRVEFVYTFARAMLGRSPVNGTGPWVGSAAYMMGHLRHASEFQRGPVFSEGAGPLKYAETLEAHMKSSAATSASRRTVSTSVSVSTLRLKLPGVVLVGPYDQVMSLFVSKTFIVEFVLLVMALVSVGIFALFEFGAEKTCRLLFEDFAPSMPGKVA
ncbi:hypothetical protein MOQ_001029 [Trypanosoma cruzi marinkellei]|uniref:Nicalin n=1 Tax=Trypanosoma cruzi marinkellei TaxID=85056 RepID=K2PCG7_TRYCR|nr:hypothetical protein MOQ_001029 [Trypanosoma cruzi marinkellei]